MFLNLSPPAPPSNGGTVFGPDMCPPGSMMVDGVCVGAGGPEQFAEREAAAKAKAKADAAKVILELPIDETGRYEAHMRQLKAEADAKILAQQNTGISPMLILVAAAAFFFAG